MLGSKVIRDRLDRIVIPLGRALARSGLTANAVTVAGMPIVAIAAWTIARGRLFLGGWLLGLGTVFDLFDGAVAKATGTGSRYGAFLDSTVDRVGEGLVLSAVAWHLAHPRFGEPPSPDWPGVGLALACLVLGFLTSYIRARAEGLGFDCKVGFAERAERLIVLGAGLVFGFLVPALAVLSAVSAFTVVQRFVHVRRQARRAPAP